MFKKFMSLALVLMMMLSVAAVGFSAAQVEVAEEAADVAVADQGAEADVAATGASTITYDNSNTNWVGPIKFYVYDPETGAELLAWGSKKLDGTDNGDGTWSYDASAMGIESGKQYAIIFNDGTSGAQTYDLMFDDSCFGDTGYATGTSLENPVDSNKTAIEAKWKNNSLGPRKQITSIGNVVGQTIPSYTNPKSMFVDFLKNTLTNARTFSGKNDQDLLDDTAKALDLTKDDVESAISEAGVTTEWSKDKSSLSGGSNSSSSGSSSTSSTSSGTSSTSSKTSTTTSSTKSGSASNTQTGQTETVLFIMLGVMVAAAGVIFFARKRERA